MATETTETQDDLEFKKLRMETRKMMIDIEHDVSQREHWKSQKRYWIIISVIAVIAVVFNGITQILEVIK